MNNSCNIRVRFIICVQEIISLDIFNIFFSEGSESLMNKFNVTQSEPDLMNESCCSVNAQYHHSSFNASVRRLKMIHVKGFFSEQKIKRCPISIQSNCISFKYIDLHIEQV